jgi:hypothetical protein
MEKVLAFCRVTYLWVILLPVSCIFIGAVSNQIAMIANHDAMPVLANSIRFDGTQPDSGMMDKQHCVMTSDTHLNMLGDIFDFGRGGIESVGDLFLDFGEWLWTFAPYVWGVLVIRKLYFSDYEGII